MVYLIMLVVSLCFCFIYDKVKMNGIFKKIFFIFSFIPFFLVSAFRYDVGTDYFGTYVKFFEISKIYGSTPYDEPLFQLLNDIIINMNLNVEWLFISTSFVINFVIFYYIFKYSPKTSLSVLLYFIGSYYFHSLNNVRQYFALAFVLIGFFQKKRILSFLFYLIAGLNHFVFLIFIPLDFILRINFSKKTIMITFSIGVLLLPLAKSFLFLILKNSKYEYFLTLDGGYSILIVLINVCISLIYFFLIKEKKDLQKNKFLIIQLIALYLSLLSLIIQQEELWVRTIKVFMFFQIFSLPYLLFHTKVVNKAERTFLSFAIIIIFTVYTVYTVLMNGAYDVLPYKWIFSIQ